MNLALQEAERASEEDEVPVGAVVVFENRLIGRGYNRMKSLWDPTAHAEILAITAACQALKQSRLDGADLYVTLEPCVMCAGAIVLAKIKRLFIATSDPKTGACGSVYDVVSDKRLNHQVQLVYGIEKDRASGLLVDYFANKRLQKKTNKKVENIRVK